MGPKNEKRQESCQGPPDIDLGVVPLSESYGFRL